MKLSDHNGNIVNFNVVEDRGDELLLWCTHGNWEGLLNKSTSTLKILDESYGWRTEEQRVLREIGVYEVKGGKV